MRITICRTASRRRDWRAVPSNENPAIVKRGGLYFKAGDFEEEGDAMARLFL